MLNDMWASITCGNKDDRQRDEQELISQHQSHAYLIHNTDYEVCHLFTPKSVRGGS